MKSTHSPAKHTIASLVAAALFVFCVLATDHARAACIARATPAPSSSPESQSEQDASAYAAKDIPPLYPMGTEVYTIDHDGTYYYYFQSNKDGSAKVKNEVRYDRNLWDTCAQLQIRFPIITKYPVVGNPYSGFGNLELGYSYSVPGKTFDHALEVRAAFPTNANHVDNTDTELKFFYTPKWKWTGGAISYTNEYDQSVIYPPGSTYTSYYEGKLVLPYFAFRHLKGLNINAFYNFRVLFDTGGLYKSAVGGQLYGSIKNVALNLWDSWGIGPNGLWRFKAEASAVVRF